MLRRDAVRDTMIVAKVTDELAGAFYLCLTACFAIAGIVVPEPVGSPQGRVLSAA